MTMRADLASFRRVEALAEVARRYAALTLALSTTVAEVLPDIDSAPAARLAGAIADVNAQLTAMDDALSAALANLPEGQPEERDA